MCDDNDMEGARLWFYGGTPPLDELQLDDQDLPALSRTGWGWPHDRSAASIDRPPELAAA